MTPHFALLLALISPLAASPASSRLSLVNEAGYNQITVTVDPGSGLADTDVTTLTGTVDTLFDIDPAAGTASALTFSNGRANGTNMAFSRSIFLIGGYNITVSNLSSTLYTILPPGTVNPVDGQFAGNQHAFDIDRGNINGSTNGLIGNNTINETFSPANPLSGIGTGQGTVTLTRIGDSGLLRSYGVVVTLPVSIADTFLTGSTTVNITGTGTLKFSGTVQVPLAGRLAIVNGDFETGGDSQSSLTPMVGWADSGATPGFWLQDGTGGGSFPQDPSAPQAGSLYLSANRLAGGAGSQPASSTLSQTVPIEGSNLTLVQAGAALLDLKFYYQDTDFNDSSTVSILFLDGTSNVISSITTGTLPDIAANATPYGAAAPWTLKNLGGAVPSNAESMRIDITTNRAAGSATNVHFDSFSAEIIADTDFDGLPDSYEQTIISANPSDAITNLSHVAGPNNLPAATDFDSDGLSDANELVNGSNPLAPDTDLDGFKDGVEVFYGSSPVSNTSLPGTGLNVVNGSFEAPVVAVSTVGVPVSGGTVTGWSVVTNEMWVIDTLATSVNDPATASQGIQFLTSNRLAPNPDALAAGFSGGNAAVMSARQDVDVTSFAAAIDAGARTVLMKFDWFDNDPFDRGSVNVRFLNGLGADLGRYRSAFTLGNPITGWQTSILPVYPPVGTRTVRITLEAANRDDAGNLTNVGSARNIHFDNIVARLAFEDSDNDGMADDWELANGLNPNNPADANAASVGGGLTNLQEFLAGSNPALADTDGDGFDDDAEVSAGTDPLDSSSFPVITPPGPLAVVSSGFNGNGDFEVNVSGLSMSYSYRLVRGTDLASFPTVVVQKVPSGSTDVFTDPEPPAGNAFYRVELVPTL